jgi:signal transduction histidine kinase
MSSSPAALLLSALALLLVALLAFLLGGQRGVAREAAALRELRESLRRSERLRQLWRWRSDTAHRLVLWQAPGAGTDGPVPATPEALATRLAAEQAFQTLLLSFDDKAAGSRQWQLSGEPLHDGQGRFAGFEGLASPQDEPRRLAADAAALTAALDALEGPALLLSPADSGWSVRRRNAAAARRWPSLVPDAGFTVQLHELPSELSAQLGAGRAPDSILRADGWGLAPLPGGSSTGAAEVGPGAVLLWQQVAGPFNSASDDDNFSFTLSHDLRAPIRVVEGFTRIVKEDYGAQLDRVGNDHLERVLGAAARMNLMIDALLKLARLSQQPLARQRVDLSQLAVYVVDELRRAGPERSVEVEIEPGMAAVGDPTLLRLVLENLIGNAWKYTARVEAARVWVGQVPQGTGRAFCVRDNGAGFDPRSAERLFGLFQRLHSASEFPGHGVGLASVRRIVQRHGGQVWAESMAGRGASFYFTVAES